MVVALVGLQLSGCHAVVTYTRSGPRVRPRPANCSFEVKLDAGGQPFTKLGVAEIEAFSPRRLPTRKEQLRPLLAPYVCKAGGNGLLPNRDSRNRFVLARIVHFGPPESLPPPPPPPPRKRRAGRGGKDAKQTASQRTTAATYTDAAMTASIPDEAN